MKRMIFFLLSGAMIASSAVVLSGCSEGAPVSIIQDVDFIDHSDFAAEASFLRELDGTTVDALRLDGINGAISLVGAPAASTVKISGIRRVKSFSTEDAQERLTQLLVDVQMVGTEIRVKTLQPQQSGGRQYLVDYTVSVPSSVDVTIKTVNGRVNVDGVLSHTSLELTGGEIQSKMTMPLDGRVDWSIVNGNIELGLQVESSAQFSATVGNGSIDVVGLALRSATQTSKSLRGQFGEGRGSIVLRTINGKISVRGY